MRRRTDVVLGIAVLMVTAGWMPHVTPGAQRKVPEDSDRLDVVMIRHNLDRSAAKLGRGLANSVTGWLEIPLTIQKRYQRDDTGTSMFIGTAMGLVRGILRTGVGLYETVTFWLPYPEEFAPILPSLEYFTKPQP